MKASFRTGAALVVAAALGAPVQAQPPPKRLAMSSYFRLAYSANALPCGHLDANKPLRGYTLDICRRVVTVLAEQIGRPLTVKYTIAKGSLRVEAVRQRQADLDFVCITDTRDSGTQIAFMLTPCTAAAQSLVSTDESDARPRSLCNRHIVRVPGTSAELTLAGHNGQQALGAIPVNVPPSAAARQMVWEGLADVFVSDDEMSSFSSA